MAEGIRFEVPLLKSAALVLPKPVQAVKYEGGKEAALDIIEWMKAHNIHAAYRPRVEYYNSPLHQDSVRGWPEAIVMVEWEGGNKRSEVEIVNGHWIVESEDRYSFRIISQVQFEREFDLVPAPKTAKSRG